MALPATEAGECHLEYVATANRLLKNPDAARSSVENRLKMPPVLRDTVLFHHFVPGLLLA